MQSLIVNTRLAGCGSPQMVTWYVNSILRLVCEDQPAKAREWALSLRDAERCPCCSAACPTETKIVRAGGG